MNLNSDALSLLEARVRDPDAYNVIITFTQKGQFYVYSNSYSSGIREAWHDDLETAIHEALDGQPIRPSKPWPSTGPVDPPHLSRSSDDLDADIEDLLG